MPRRLGQHFLRDRSVLAKIVAALDLGQSDVVLEVGPGQGVLTRELAASGATITAVELDRALVAQLQAEFEGMSTVTIVAGDVLQIDPVTLVGPSYKLAGNIPYYITGQLLRKFLTGTNRPSVAVLMVQLEVARRMLAVPGDMSLLSVSTRLFTEPSLVARVSRRSFHPPPQVDSAVIKLEVLPQPRVEITSESQFFRVVRAGFGTKRKQVANALAHGLSMSKTEMTAVLEAASIDSTLRAEDLSLQDWSRLALLVALRDDVGEAKA
jgi:16S rRNA (adenine1518-N6/adenine1519-N6)-dimethyltransferase